MADMEAVEYAHSNHRREEYGGISALRVWTMLNVCAIVADASFLLLCILQGTPLEAMGWAALTVILVCSVIGIVFVGVVQIVLTLCFLRRASIFDLIVLGTDALLIAGLLVTYRRIFPRVRRASAVVRSQ